MVKEATNQSSDGEPLVKRATTDKPKKRRRESSQNASLEAIRTWLGARIEKDPSPLSRAEIETWLTQNRSRLPEEFLSKELFQQRQYCYDIFAKNGGMRRRKVSSLSELASGVYLLSLESSPEFLNLQDLSRPLKGKIVASKCHERQPLSSQLITRSL